MSGKEAVATAVPMSGTTIPSGGAPGVAMHLQPKQGAKCCGCWCDYRRAVIVIAIVFIILSVIALVGALSSFAIPGSAININDDEVLEVWEDNLKTQAILNGISLFFSACALAGARQYNIYLVGSNIIWLIVQWIVGIFLSIANLDDVNTVKDDDLFVEYQPNVAGYVINALITLLFIYPHAGFIHEVKRGIMSAETYPREEYSCCCVDRRH
mmetsp:Transcript_133467/g.198389  ORF Transcript_133467/g.198389 Transcript_133467/m.198389 type:complete len:212 (-) Transcript_133467:161-796(-)|eukprot:CAMPEP_0117015978 /NCGR_PEP_ID=MMETSP0472-20121206/12660_1 /TAXON_ID=693140 ORGANISM="Tiarina fusus, Strain LIS" /NCGR_SAMPLE_ID=MMETSP0472 /ASSEMBLY_ACC=CAM_ASM_000603 /LENGTH=211 /DNA_ID=CAMNT_0004719891 /DNA_START=134 /DNA_END=769 /DNA_ORIENTATION=+